MAVTVAEMLKASGMTDEQIAGLDAKIVTGFQTVLTTAEQAQLSASQLKEQAELANRAQTELYDKEIAPALDQWGNEKVMLESERSFYRAQNEAARSAGFIPNDAPTFQPGGNPNRNQNPNAPTYVPGANVVPGSPAFMTKAEGVRAVANATWVITEHMRLHGAPPPDDIETLASEAERQHLDFREHVKRKYNFEGRRKEIVEKKQNEEIDRRVAEQVKVKEQQLVEKFGSNPNVRMGAPSEFTNLRKGVDQKQVKDPLSMNKQERRDYTASLINRDMVENASQVN